MAEGFRRKFGVPRHGGVDVDGVLGSAVDAGKVENFEEKFGGKMEQAERLTLVLGCRGRCVPITTSGRRRGVD